MEYFTVGPVACYPEVLKEMGHQMFSHASERYKRLHKETTEKLKQLLETEQHVFLIPSSGTGLMEASVRNCVEDRMMVCVNGTFGERYAAVGESNGKHVERLEVPYGEPVTSDLLDKKLSLSPDVEAVAIIHNETSTGVLNPLPELAGIVKKHDKLLFVDAVSSMGGVEIKVDQWGIDICFSSSQKCLGVPPGLAIGSVSEKALQTAEKARNKGWYFDFVMFENFLQGWRTHMTPPIPLVFALKKALEIIEEGGKKQWFKLYEERSKKIRKGVQELGISLFSEEGYESPTVTCMKPPEHRGIDEVVQGMHARGFALAKGYGEKLKDTTWRIGNMGYINDRNINLMLQALGEVLK